MKHCIVGDVHGEYGSLLNLVAKIPKDTKLIFVGDLIDRGTQSAQVVRFIRDNNLPCVKGNHEAMMIEYGSEFVHAIENNEEIDQDSMWFRHGGIETLLSYGLIYIHKNRVIPHIFIKEFIFLFKDDLEWMKTLPLYLELDDIVHPSGRKVVVSHSSIASVWSIRHEKDKRELFIDKVLWSRTPPIDEEAILNIFGHTPQKYGASEYKHYINVDTGCYKKADEGYGILSAYCVESGEVFSTSELSYEMAS